MSFVLGGKASGGPGAFLFYVAIKLTKEIIRYETLLVSEITSFDCRCSKIKWRNHHGYYVVIKGNSFYKIKCFRIQVIFYSK
ncbi:hypothetical protein BW897_13035 [Bacillus cereus]|uniref:Uncharacterized protein n=1 Tax=Bacillus cereus TaxID=1396 RepID=A0A1S9TQT3_BACCE|nr:hypothetical protein BW897_13035 [Bacillus cereus]OOR63550.1 hypothetical protein BLX04_08830 [Bacillus mycoides]